MEDKLTSSSPPENSQTIPKNETSNYEDDSKSNVKIADILENILRENGQMQLTNSSDSDGSIKSDNISSVIEQLNEVIFFI